MKYLKEFNKFDMGRFSSQEEDNIEVTEIEDDYIDTNQEEEISDLDIEEEEEEEEEEIQRKLWGDELVEKKTIR